MPSAEAQLTAYMKVRALCFLFELQPARADGELVELARKVIKGELSIAVSPVSRSDPARAMRWILIDALTQSTVVALGEHAF